MSEGRLSLNDLAKIAPLVQAAKENDRLGHGFRPPAPEQWPVPPDNEGILLSKWRVRQGESGGPVETYHLELLADYPATRVRQAVLPQVD
jgi:hypothetical protein